MRRFRRLGGVYKWQAVLSTTMSFLGLSLLAKRVECSLERLSPGQQIMAWHLSPGPLLRWHLCRSLQSFSWRECGSACTHDLRADHPIRLTRSVCRHCPPLQLHAQSERPGALSPPLHSLLQNLTMRTLLPILCRRRVDQGVDVGKRSQKLVVSCEYLDWTSCHAAQYVQFWHLVTQIRTLRQRYSRVRYRKIWSGTKLALGSIFRFRGRRWWIKARA